MRNAITIIRTIIRLNPPMSTPRTLFSYFPYTWAPVARSYRIPAEKFQIAAVNRGMATINATEMKTYPKDVPPIGVIGIPSANNQKMIARGIL